MTTNGKDSTITDIIAVGAGPAALGMLHAAKGAGLTAFAIDKGPVCSALCSHPTYMRWFSTTDKLELAGFPLLTPEKNPTRQEYLKYCRAFANYYDLQIETYREVTSIQKDGDLFVLHGKDMFDREYTWCARNVVVATGFYDSPRPVGVKGEALPKVSHRYTEPHWYSDHDVMIIGAGSSAAEIALELWRNGAHVTVVMRSNKFHTKYWVEPDIENRIKEGSITCYRNAEPVEIQYDDVLVRTETGDIVAVPNHFVLAMTGYEPDTSLVEGVGAVIDHSCGKPELSDEFETTVAGLYVAGTLCAGQESNVVFVENSRDHGPIIVKHIESRRTEGRLATDEHK
jgi:thioredoxin reductase (NADPH)